MTFSTSVIKTKIVTQIQEEIEMSLISEFYPQLIQKGYTEREIREDSKKTPTVREVPESMKHRFDSYEEYLSECMDYLNGL